MIAINNSLMETHIMNHVKPTFRTIEQINTDIDATAKKLKDLQQEHRIARRDIAKRISAVNVLENLGWTFNGSSWDKPKIVTSDTVKARYHSDKSPVREGDLATWDNKVLGGNVYVRHLVPGSDKALVSWVSNISLRGFTAGEASFTVDVSELTARHRHYFIGL